MIVALREGAARVKQRVADRGDAGPKLQDALQDLGGSAWMEIVPKAKGAQGLTVAPRRGVVERPVA